MSYPIYIDPEREETIYSTGTIINKVEIVDNKEVFSVEWKGGNRIAITGTLLRELVAEDNYYTNGRMENTIRCKLIHNTLTIGQFKLRIIHHIKKHDVYIAKRIN